MYSIKLIDKAKMKAAPPAVDKCSLCPFRFLISMRLINRGLFFTMLFQRSKMLGSLQTLPSLEMFSSLNMLQFGTVQFSEESFIQLELATLLPSEIELLFILIILYQLASPPLSTLVKTSPSDQTATFILASLTTIALSVPTLSSKLAHVSKEGAKSYLTPS